MNPGSEALGKAGRIHRSERKHTMTEDEKRRAGVLFFPGDPELKEIKRRTHNLNLDYNATYEDEIIG